MVLLCCVHLLTPKWHSPMTLGLRRVPFLWLHCEWELAGFCQVHLLPSQPRKKVFVWRLLLVSDSCFPWLLSTQCNSAGQGWVGLSCVLGSYSIRWLIIPSWVALRNSGWIHHHVHLFGPKRGSLGQGAIVAVFIVVPYPFSWSHLMESKSKRWGHPRTGEQRVPTQMRRVRRKSEGGSPKGLALEPDTCAPHQEICKMEM